MHQTETGELDELDVLRGLCHAFGSTPDLSESLALSLRWVEIALAPGPSLARISRPDASGRLRVVAGRHSPIGRKRSARRRTAFLRKQEQIVELRPPSEQGLLFLPLVARGACLGVLEIEASLGSLQLRRPTLESIA